ncbi:MAG: hypothetical protein CMH53_04990 [Myxococcales bacterium]|nr:hypothetical protein [Myxococcales bacterium]
MRFAIVASVMGFIGVGLGAFGAHGLKRWASAADLEIWQTAVRYHLIHTVVLLWVALTLKSVAGVGAEGIEKSLNWAGWSFVFGILVFSGSLYTLVLSGVRRLGMVTPIGGAGFLLGWAALGYACYRMSD